MADNYGTYILNVDFKLGVTITGGLLLLSTPESYNLQSFKYSLVALAYTIIAGPRPASVNVPVQCFLIKKRITTLQVKNISLELGHGCLWGKNIFQSYF